MPRITSITDQKANARRFKEKKDKRYNIFLNGKYAFSVGEENLLKLQLKEGQNISESRINSLKKEENQNKLLDKAINFLSYRLRSEQEIKDYLIKTISKSEKVKWVIAKESGLPEYVIKKLKKYGYVNDIDFTKWWIQSRTKARPKGRKLIEIELIKKGINKELINKLLPPRPKTDLELALKVLEKKRTKLEKLEPREVQRRIFNYLISRGFDYDVIHEAFAIYSKKR